MITMKCSECDKRVTIQQPRAVLQNPGLHPAGPEGQRAGFCPGSRKPMLQDDGRRVI